jgi:hypothetical protein
VGQWGPSANQTRANPKQVGKCGERNNPDLRRNLRHLLLVGTRYNISALALRGNGFEEEEHQISVLCFVA